MDNTATPVAPARNGVAASRVQLPAGPWLTVLDALSALFPAITRECWQDRLLRGLVLDARGERVTVAAAYRLGADIYYYREVANEPIVSAQETLLHVDADLLVVDKPHGLPVTPSGSAVAETLLARLSRRLPHAQLVPLHRIDRETAGLVLFSVNPKTRAQYHALFSQRAIGKLYHALAAPLPQLAFPHVRASRLQRGEPFFRMCEGEGEANSETRIEVIAQGDDLWRYALQPITGRKHQLRVHMAALGAPIRNDACYPTLRDGGINAPAAPLQLLAKALDFVDPLSGQWRRFESRLVLLEGNSAT